MIHAIKNILKNIYFKIFLDTLIIILLITAILIFKYSPCVRVQPVQSATGQVCVSEYSYYHDKVCLYHKIDMGVAHKDTVYGMIVDDFEVDIS